MHGFTHPLGAYFVFEEVLNGIGAAALHPGIK